MYFFPVFDYIPIIKENDKDHFPRYLIKWNLQNYCPIKCEKKKKVNVASVLALRSFDIFQSLHWFSIFKSIAAIWEKEHVSAQCPMG